MAHTETECRRWALEGRRLAKDDAIVKDAWLGLRLGNRGDLQAYGKRERQNQSDEPASH